MDKIIVAYDKEVIIASKTENSWSFSSHLKGTNPVSIYQDPIDPLLVYCGTFDRGLWRSIDGGDNWEAVGTRFHYNEPFTSEDIHLNTITSVYVKEEDWSKDFGSVYVGTEPSALFVSHDKGESFTLLTDYEQFESKKDWFFPPRPHTHHVKWIEIDKNAPYTLFTTIEAGGLIKSIDNGSNWKEVKKDTSPIDIHVLKSHEFAPNRLYGILGDHFLEKGRSTYVESTDLGNSWQDLNDGLEKHPYGYHLAINSKDPNSILIAVAKDPYTAHVYNDGNCESTLYKSDISMNYWKEVTVGLPNTKGTLISALSEKNGIFFAANNKGVFFSKDKGETWNGTFNIPERLKEQHSHDVKILD